MTRPDGTSRRRLVVAVLLAAYLIAAIVIALWPTHVDEGLAPNLLAIAAWLRDHGAPGWVDYTHIEFIANILFFVPVGALAGLLLGRSWWLVAALIGADLSLVFESIQAVFLPGRTSTWNDVIANSTGALIGAGLQLLIPRRMHGADAAHPDDPHGADAPATVAP